MGRREDMHQPHLPRGEEKKCFRITGVEITHILMKRPGELMSINKERWSLYIEQTWM